MSYYRRRRTFDLKPQVKNPNIGPRLDKILAEPSIDARTRTLLSSFKEQYDKRKSLSEKQYAIMEKIEAATLSPQAKKIAGEWRKRFKGTELEEKFRICAEYYKDQMWGSYREVSQRYLTEPDFVPTETQYKRLCENKYALKVLKATRQKPLYAKNQLVVFRAQAKNIPAKVRRNGIALVIKPNSSPPKNAAKGAKRYLVLPFGSTQPIEVEEREIKKAPKKTNKKENT